ncbi:homeodomain-interacting protein kinase 2-like [Boleophthalmus pectinirostris]|uniref:homeodomain-interacting protein kinase 2-like n=1 Tax=Boleophthalmus pectinirostris TaxID=150288 RepID=UPI00242C56FA|nr:homeodomain-interacting protein kinase 2-like [Boleophthalmus pectinirostris]
MSSWDTYETSGAAAPQPSSEVTIGHTLQGRTDSYSVLEWLGEGCFGRVAKCHAVDQDRIVAVKLLKEQQFKDMEHEVSHVCQMKLEAQSVHDGAAQCPRPQPHKHRVCFLERFEVMGLHCLAFEMLEVDLFSFMSNRDWVPLQLNEIRPIAHQLLVALDALKGLGIVHTDIKPDNIMFSDLEEHPLKVKLIDFGEARKVSQVQLGATLQPCGSRAPEVTLGLPYTEAIDVWGVGCILAFLYLAENLFPVTCEYQAVKRLVTLLGMPPDHLLEAGLYSNNFFTQVQSSNSAAWRLLTAEEYAAKYKTTTEEEHSYFEVPSCLDGLVCNPPENSTAKVEDRKAFLDLLKGLLNMFGDQRLTPSQALQHNYITMGHLQKAELQGYFMISEELMSICPSVDSSLSPLKEDQTSVSDATAESQTDAPKSDTSTGQDSGWESQSQLIMMVKKVSVQTALVLIVEETEGFDGAAEEDVSENEDQICENPGSESEFEEKGDRRVKISQQSQEQEHP